MFIGRTDAEQQQLYCCLVTELCPTLLLPHILQCTRLLSPWAFQARTLEWVPFPSPGDLPDPGFEPESPALQAVSLPLSHQGSPQQHFWPLFTRCWQQLLPLVIIRDAPNIAKCLLGSKLLPVENHCPKVLGISCHVTAF